MLGRVALAFTLCAAAPAAAQTAAITGTITDAETGAPVAGATVMLRGTPLSVSSSSETRMIWGSPGRPIFEEPARQSKYSFEKMEDFVPSGFAKGDRRAGEPAPALSMASWLLLFAAHWT